MVTKERPAVRLFELATSYFEDMLATTIYVDSSKSAATFALRLMASKSLKSPTIGANVISHYKKLKFNAI